MGNSSSTSQLTDISTTVLQNVFNISMSEESTDIQVKINLTGENIENVDIQTVSYASSNTSTQFSNTAQLASTLSSQLSNEQKQAFTLGFNENSSNFESVFKTKFEDSTLNVCSKKSKDEIVDKIEIVAQNIKGLKIKMNMGTDNYTNCTIATLMDGVLKGSANTSNKGSQTLLGNILWIVLAIVVIVVVVFIIKKMFGGSKDGDGGNQAAETQLLEEAALL